MEEEKSDMAEVRRDWYGSYYLFFNGCFRGLRMRNVVESPLSHPVHCSYLLTATPKFLQPSYTETDEMHEECAMYLSVYPNYVVSPSSINA